MHVDLTEEEADLLKMLLLAELEAKRVEMHHARNIDYKAELQNQAKAIQGMLQRFAR
jgi:hypothetical protein